VCNWFHYIVGDRRKDRRKKRPVNIVSFDPDDTGMGLYDTCCPAARVDSCTSTDVSKNSSLFCVFDMDPINNSNHQMPLETVRCSLGNHISSSDRDLCVDDAAVSSSTPTDCGFVGVESTGAINRTDMNIACDLTPRDDWYVGNNVQMKTADSESINSGNSTASADSICR